MDLVLALIVALSAVLGVTHMASNPRQSGTHTDSRPISFAQVQARLAAEQSRGGYRS